MLLVSEHPTTPAQAVYVSGRVATVLRFELECDPAKTRLETWEGRFEPLLVGSRKVVLEPTRDLGPDERASLVVTLVDGTRIPFLVSPARSEWPWVDHQVNVFRDPNSFDAVRSALHDALRREKRLSEQIERLKKDERSLDRALATILVNGEAKKTTFRPVQSTRLRSEGLDILIDVFSGPGKAATLITLSNDPGGWSWRLGEARLSADLTTRTARPFTLSMEREEIKPGQSGMIAVVVDDKAFALGRKPVDLALQLFRDDGHEQVVVKMAHTLIRK